MTDPRNILIKDYSYNLPEDRIARYPLEERDASRLLIYHDGMISEDIYRNIADHIPGNAWVFFNKTRVVEARLLFQKQSGGVIEIFCLEPHEQYPDITSAMLQTGKVYWQCLVGGASKWKKGQVLEKKKRHHDKEIILNAVFAEKKTGSFIIELSWSPLSLTFAEILHVFGAIPLPPYIKRAAEEQDAIRYQTVYAREDGSVAAPTAGLHFTDSIFNRMKEKNIQTGFVTLHVGAGTFKPVKTETISGHEMHDEWMDVSKKTIENILNNLDKKIIAVGTTSLRTLESLYWLGRKPELRSGLNDKELNMNSELPEQGSGFRVSQWEPYESNGENISVEKALENLLNRMTRNNMDRLVAKTQLLIAPGYGFRIADGLITNFHQPQSTLLLLVAALIGSDWKKVYDHALQHGFRFLSYGDGCLLWGMAGKGR